MTTRTLHLENGDISDTIRSGYVPFASGDHDFHMTLTLDVATWEQMGRPMRMTVTVAS